MGWGEEGRGSGGPHSHPAPLPGWPSTGGGSLPRPPSSWGGLFSQQLLLCSFGAGVLRISHVLHPELGSPAPGHSAPAVPNLGAAGHLPSQEWPVEPRKMVPLNNHPLHCPPKLLVHDRCQSRSEHSIGGNVHEAV